MSEHLHGAPDPARQYLSDEPAQNSDALDGVPPSPASVPIPDEEVPVPAPVDESEMPMIRVDHVRRLKLEPDDILVVSVPSTWPKEVLGHAQEGLRQALGEDRKIIFTSDDVELTTMRELGDLTR